MGSVVMQASMPLGGSIADPSDDIGPLFDSYRNGDVEFTGTDPGQVIPHEPGRRRDPRLAWANPGAWVNRRRRPPGIRTSPSARATSAANPRPLKATGVTHLHDRLRNH